jgi:hypothetical protein
MPEYPSERLKQTFSTRENVLRAEFEEIRSEYQDAGVKGDEAEDIVGKFLGEYLPRVYGWGSGETIDRRGESSREQDIVICNQYHPYTYSQGRRGFFFKEGVESVVEVKSILNKDAIENCIEKCLSLRTLETNIPGGTTAYEHGTGTLKRVHVTPFAVFAFESPYTTETLYKKVVNLHEEVIKDRNNTIDLIFVLDEALIVDTKEFDHLRVGPVGDPQYGYSLIPSDSDTPLLLEFMIFLQDKMPEIQYMPNLIKQYLDIPQEDD